MTEPNEQQKALIEQHKLNPDNWLVYAETSKKLVLLSRRTKQRRVLQKVGVE